MEHDEKWLKVTAYQRRIVGLSPLAEAKREAYAEHSAQLGTLMELWREMQIQAKMIEIMEEAGGYCANCGGFQEYSPAPIDMKRIRIQAECELAEMAFTPEHEER